MKKLDLFPKSQVMNIDTILQKGKWEEWRLTTEDLISFQTVTAVKHSTNISQIKTDGTFYQQIKNENQGYRANQSIKDWVVDKSAFDIVTTNEQNEDGIGQLDLIIKKHTQEISANGIVPLVHTLYGVELRPSAVRVLENGLKWPAWKWSLNCAEPRHLTLQLTLYLKQAFHSIDFEYMLDL